MSKCLLSSETKKFKLGIDEKLLSDIRIKYNKLKKELDANNKLKKCFWCENMVSSFCQSHHIPDFIIKSISENGDVYNYYSGVDNLNHYKTKKGRGEAGVFRIICRECDQKVFANYEDTNNYGRDSFKGDFKLIALKNYFKWLHKRLYEKIVYEAYVNVMDKYKNFFLSDILLYNECIARELDLYFFCEEQLSNINADIKNYKNKIMQIKNKECNYQLFYYKNLDYVVPLAIQTMIPLYADFNDTLINNCFDINFIPNELHLAVFPYKNGSYILLGADNSTGMYNNFIDQFNALEEQDKLSAINYLIVRYSEDYFYTEDVKNKISADELMKKRIDSTSIYTTYITYFEIFIAFLSAKQNNIPFNLSQFFRDKKLKFKKDSLNFIIQNHSLKNRFDIPNLLDKKYAIR